MKNHKVVLIDSLHDLQVKFIKMIGKEFRLSSIVETKPTAIIEFIQREAPTLIFVDINLLLGDDHYLLNSLLTEIKIPFVALTDGSVTEFTKAVVAISKGAIDYVDKTAIDRADEATAKKLKVLLIKELNMAKTKEQEVYKMLDKTRHQSNLKQEKKNIIVAIGTSTGGPKALQKVLKALPQNFPAPIVIVQHMPKGFTKSLAEHLNRICKISVKEAQHGEKLKVATAYIAPGNYHMTVDNDMNELKIALSQDAVRSGHRPSVNVLFDSLALLKNISKVAVVLTGMGKDGAEGVSEIKRMDNEAIILVESKESAIIYGMPKAVVETNEVSEIVHLNDIGQTIINHVMNGRTSIG